MSDFAWDNDVLIKLTIYDLGHSLLAARLEHGPNEDQLVLATARWVGRQALARRIARGDAPEDALERFADLLSRVSEVEPTKQEIDLATDLEELALAKDLPLDGGESLLTAICVSRAVKLLTGDKRAVKALQALADDDQRLNSLLGAVYCLEQAVMALATWMDGSVVRERICNWPNADSALRFAVECSRSTTDLNEEGLLSFISSLRGTAPMVLGVENRLPD